MPRTEFWTSTGEFTASGDTRFVKATLAHQWGKRNIRVDFDDNDDIIHVELDDLVAEENSSTA